MVRRRRGGRRVVSVRFMVRTARCLIRLAATAAVAATLACAAPAVAAPRLVTLPMPSAGNVDTSQPVLSPGVGALRANVLLPDGYSPDRAYPVLYLLHGISDDFSAWASPSRGDVLRTVAGLHAIVVMPEGGRGFYVNWRERQGRDWERYVLEEVIPEVERRYRILPGRQHRTIAGASMGGYGALRLASQLPGYFGSAISISGFLEISQIDYPLLPNGIIGAPFSALLGPLGGGYARGHELRSLRDNLRHTRVLISVGNGYTDPRARDPLHSMLLLANSERYLELHSSSVARSFDAAGVPVTFRRRSGIHAWWYWRRDLRAAIDTWGVFGAPRSDTGMWEFMTVSQRGLAWDLRFRFASPPDAPVTFRRAGGILRGEGAGTVTIEGPEGCRFTAALPFTRACTP